MQLFRIPALILTALIFSGCETAQTTSSLADGQDEVRTLIVHYADEPKSVLDAVQSMGDEVVYHLSNMSIIVVRLSPSASVPASMKIYDSIEGVVAVRKDQSVHLNGAHSTDHLR